MSVDHGLDVARARRHLRALPLDAAVESVETAAMDLHARRVAREPRPRSGPPPRCAACCRFVGGNPCVCGFRPGQGYAA